MLRYFFNLAVLFLIITLVHSNDLKHKKFEKNQTDHVQSIKLTTIKSTLSKNITLDNKNKNNSIYQVNHTYTVFKVADGDTITVRNHSDNLLVRIRFL